MTNSTLRAINGTNQGTGQLQVGRHLPGSALESAFVFVLGGRTAAEAATKTTESTHW
jgi:hypothetical protein